MDETKQKPQKPNSDVSRLERMRKKRKLRKIRRASVAVLLVAVILAYFTGFYNTSIVFLSDVFEAVSVAATPGQDYPASFNVPGFVQAEAFAGGFVAVGEQDMLIQSAAGAEIKRIQHGYARASVTAGSNRVCIYNRADKSLKVESRNRSLFEIQLEDPILLCEMSKNGTLAVFTKSRLLVYNRVFENVFNFYTKDLPTAMAFCADNKQLALGCPYAENGALGGVIYLLNIDKDEPVAEIRNAQGLPLQIKYFSRKQVLVVYDTYLAVYDTNDGTELYSYSYAGQTLQSASINENNIPMLLFGDGTHGSLTNLVILNTKLEVTGSAAVGICAESLSATRSGAYILTRDNVLGYKLDGTFIGQLVTDARPLAVIDTKDLLLLTEKTVSELKIPNT